MWSCLDEQVNTWLKCKAGAFTKPDGFIIDVSLNLWAASGRATPRSSSASQWVNDTGLV
jgi:hypothetical protein